MEEASFNCLYCGLDKPTAESSLEHAIPQFLGGEFAPAKFRLSNVCKSCNNNLGLFVDASYAKSWFVTNGLAEAARSLYTSPSDRPIPLVCIGQVNIDGLSILEDQVSEYWIGPSGESVVWIRSHKERMYWYTGGSPIDAKKKPSVAYLALTSSDPTRYQMGIASFLEAFKDKKARKVLCTKLHGLPNGIMVIPGFDIPNSDEEANILAIQKVLTSGERLKTKAAFNAKFDLRFISKLVLGVGYSLFGVPYLMTPTAQEARKGCWPKTDDPSKLQGSSSLGNVSESVFSQISGYPGAVAIMIMRSGSFYSMSVTIDQKLPFVVHLAPSELSSTHIDSELGYVLLLFPALKQALELTLVDFLAHKTKDRIHPTLDKVDEKIRAAAEFHARLSTE